MTKPNELKIGDTVAIVSLSKGILGEKYISHELEIGKRRLNEMGLNVVFMPNSLKGKEYLNNHPEARAEDLKLAFADDNINAIICAIGGNDTYRLLPYLMEDQEFINNVKTHPKIFMGFSDTTINHLMFYKLGLSTFYGPSFITDLAELDKNMLPYTEKYFKKLFSWDDNLEIESSPVWYQERESYGVSEIGKSRGIVNEEHGFEVLNGSGIVEGELFGGCLDSINSILVGKCPEEKELFEKYNLLPTKEDLKGKILFLETSETKITPEELSKALNTFKENRFFETINGVIIGKPIANMYYDEYKEVYTNFFKNTNIPVMYNVNFGHSVPRCIIPYGVKAKIDYDNKKIYITETPIISQCKTKQKR